MILSSLSEVWNFVNTTKSSLAANYNRIGLKASGSYQRELESFVEIEADRVRYGIKGAEHSEYMEEGRRPNQNQTPEALRAWVGFAGSTFLAKWVKDKGLSISPYAVAYKIARQGIKVPNQNNPGGVISDIINEQWFKAGIEVYGAAARTTFSSQVLSSLKLVR